MQCDNMKISIIDLSSVTFGEFLYQPSQTFFGEPNKLYLKTFLWLLYRRSAIEQSLYLYSYFYVYLSLMTILLLIRRADQLLGGLWGRIWCDVPTLGPNMSRREQRARAPDWGENSYFLPLSRIVLPTTLDISCSPFPAAVSEKTGQIETLPTHPTLHSQGGTKTWADWEIENN